jgi:hypothetical protein
MIRRRDRNAIGETRLRLAGLIAEQIGVDIAPENLISNRGARITNDEERGGGDGTRCSTGLGVRLTSFATMTEIVRSGIVAVVADERETIEVCNG